ncbi:hypothetical protein PGUG_04047 [Meyerozyma guilliermondii ATCC 6260]|uniref:Uncharacterized protein n=1 Tax=Meyerozyma guilliermondii (strain ATCC 6260 / CBS 566 / DSM 6381 / JCM 1539 / NBRC 10279 / NRRL Y-324) TaxID=294746 RepID=A5DL96_PICGU|nr:uncharacterized protein PGUG_04047 [Meyerozyma guilliermondii ATCC 6260]EDK39949.2 hypothetical protein PGUG_04047 [Meyerozyma guilliermondii ATCC 6260]
MHQGTSDANGAGDYAPSHPQFDRSGISDASYIEMLLFENRELQATVTKQEQIISGIRDRLNGTSLPRGKAEKVAMSADVTAEIEDATANSTADASADVSAAEVSTADAQAHVPTADTSVLAGLASPAALASPALASPALAEPADDVPVRSARRRREDDSVDETSQLDIKQASPTLGVTDAVDDRSSLYSESNSPARQSDGRRLAASADNSLTQHKNASNSSFGSNYKPRLKLPATLKNNGSRTPSASAPQTQSSLSQSQSQSQTSQTHTSILSLQESDLDTSSVSRTLASSTSGPIPPATPDAMQINKFPSNMSIDDRSIVSNPQSPPMHEPLRTPSGLLSHESLTAKLSRQPTTPGSSFQVMPSTVQEDEETTLLVKPDNFNTIDIVVASTINVHHQEVSLQRKSDDPNVSISICDKASGKEMWRIRKSYSQLVAFDNEIRPIVEYFGLPPLPEKTLFFSSSPPKVDTRRLQLQDFFNTLFLIPHIPRMLLFRICKYLSADLVNPLDDFKSGASKEGFLIRRYKGLGSTWKVRWCQVDGPYLEIYEAPGGTFLEQLPLWHTQIGRQSSDSVAEDKGYRHAFLILEQEKFKMSSTSKHFFCAESDTERDSWISALIQYTGWSDSATPAESTDSLVRGSERFGSNERVENLDEKEREKETKKSRKRSLFPFRKNADDDQSSQNQNQNSQPNSNSQFSSSQFSNSHQNSNSNSNSQPYQSAQLQPHFLSQPLSQASSELPSYIGNMKLDDSPAKTIFGRDVLEAYNLSHHEFQGRSIPSVCFRCLDYLVKTGAVYEEGIFRLSGSASQIRGLREQFNTKFDIDLCANPSPDIHTVAGLFKTYLRELPHPILGAQPYSDLQHIVMSRGDTGSKSSCGLHFPRLPFK